MKAKYRKIISGTKKNILKFHRHYLIIVMIIWISIISCILLEVNNNLNREAVVPAFKNKEFVTFKSGLSGYVEGFTYVNGEYVYNVIYHTNHNIKVKNIVISESKLLVDRD